MKTVKLYLDPDFSKKMPCVAHKEGINMNKGTMKRAYVRCDKKVTGINLR